MTLNTGDPIPSEFSFGQVSSQIYVLTANLSTLNTWALTLKARYDDIDYSNGVERNFNLITE